MKNLLKALKARHEILNARIDTEQRSRTPDVIRVSAMKRIKLGLKDQIAKLEQLGRQREFG